MSKKRKLKYEVRSEDCRITSEFYDMLRDIRATRKNEYWLVQKVCYATEQSVSVIFETESMYRVKVCRFMLRMIEKTIRHKYKT